MKIIAYTIQPINNKLQITSSTSEHSITEIADNLDHALEILTLPYEEQVLRICWNLDATIAPLLRLLGKELCKKLHRTNKSFCRPYSIFYISDKLFSIKRIPSKEKMNFYSLEQYFPDYNEPENAQEIARLGEKLLTALNKMGLYPTKLTSPVAIWEQSIMNHLNLPTAWDMPKEAAKFAHLCSGKLWIECYQVGFWEQAYDYDIIASFPTVAKNLIDIRHCEWIEDNNYQANAIYGYCKGEVTIYDHIKVSPIIHEAEDGKLTTPTSTWNTYLTKSEIDFILKWDLGQFESEEGWWAIPRQMNKPLGIPMDRLLAFRNNDNKLIKMLAKRMSVGIYGKFGEEHKEKFGKHFNSCWFAEISTSVRLQVAEFIYKHKLQDNLIHVSVDGILVDKEIKI